MRKTLYKGSWRSVVKKKKMERTDLYLLVK